MLPVVVVQLATKALLPETHSPLISEYTWTEWDAPSVDFAETAKYEKGIDCFNRSVGCKFRLN